MTVYWDITQHAPPLQREIWSVWGYMVRFSIYSTLPSQLWSFCLLILGQLQRCMYKLGRPPLSWPPEKPQLIQDMMLCLIPSLMYLEMGYWGGIRVR
jgi:hypothetical protein